ncbi:MAG: hypothetical protein ACI9N1_001683 [Flavobacteriales bacterium]|jgi:hypothetical protein
MKKLYTFLGAALIAGSVSAQTYLGKDFEDQSITSGGFSNTIVTGTSDWFIGTYSSNNFAKMSNYSGGSNAASEAWLITPVVDLTAAITPIFSFSSSSEFIGADLEIFSSTDYDGTSNPSSQGTWAALTAPLSTGNYDWINSGEIAVTGASATTYFAFKYTGSASDGKTWQIDSIFVAETGTAYNTTVGGGGGGATTAASIYEIQYSTATPADSPFTGQIVETGGIVTYVRGDGNYYIQSGNGPFSGVYVFDASQSVAIGDSVTFEAEVDEFYDLTELKNISSFVNVSSGNFFMSNAVSTGDMGTEPYEGVLISTCGTVTSVDQFDNFTFDDGTGGAVGDPYVADFHLSGSNINAPAAGITVVVKGIVDYSFSEFKVLPRSSSDVNATAQCVVSINENVTTFNMYPNPTEGTLNIEVEGNNFISILDVRGAVIRTIQSNDFTTLDVSDLASGMYFLKVNNTTKRFAVK